LTTTPGFEKTIARHKTEGYAPMNRHVDTIESMQPRQVLPATPATIQALRDMNPEELLDNMPMALVNQIVGEWRKARDTPGLATAKKESVAQYMRNATRLERTYSQEHGVEYGLLNPIDCIKSFFFHATDLSDQTWSLYRYSFLHALNERAMEMEKKGIPQKSLMTALAGLIVASKRPQSFSLNGARKRPPRPAKSIRMIYFTELVNYLVGGFPEKNTNARRAQSFAMAALATGLRPIEWANAVLREPTADEVKGLGNPADWLAIDVTTAKRKDNEKEWMRTLLIPPGAYQIHIRQHYDAVQEYIRESRARSPMVLYIRHCSTVMAAACEQLWPYQPDRRFTLKTLRSQARANFAAKYGHYVAAAMLGHSPGTSMSSYAGKHRANLPRRASGFGDVPVLIPGENVYLKAKEFASFDQTHGLAEGPQVSPSQAVGEGAESDGVA
jgi:hypothetical protein